MIFEWHDGTRIITRLDTAYDSMNDMDEDEDFSYEPEDYEDEPTEDEPEMDESDPFYFSEGMHL